MPSGTNRRLAARAPRNRCHRLTSARAGFNASIGLLGVDRIDRAVPWTMIFVQQILGRRFAARQALVEQIEIAAFVAAGCVSASTACEPRPREPENVRGQNR